MAISLPAVESSSEMARSTSDLLASLTRRIVIAACGTHLLTYGFVVAVWPHTFHWHMVAVTILVVVSTIACVRFLSGQPNVAQAVWQLGIAAAILWATRVYGDPNLAFLYSLLTTVAAINFGWTGGLALLIGTSILALLGISGVGGTAAPAWHFAAVLGVGTLSVTIGWAVRDTVATGVGWYRYSLQQSRENLAVARQHRADLMRAQRCLDQAYTRLERANAALVAAWKAADEAEHLKGEMLATISHELRTPLNLIVGFAEMMVSAPESYDNTPLPGAYRTDLNTIYHNARHLLALVDDVLDLAIAQAGKINLLREEFSIVDLVTEAVEMLKDYVAAKRLELNVSVQPDLPFIYADRLRIRQVLLNLLVNAVRFTDQGHIAIEVTKRGEDITVRVSDTGRGIPNHELPHVFDEFRSAQSDTPAWHSGSGLGLPISKRFVELHGGHMAVESEESRGTTFSFSLPVGLAAQVARRITPSRRNPPAMPGVEARASVVLVRTDSAVKRLCQRRLSEYDVLEAPDTLAGLKLAREVNAVAVLTSEAIPVEMAPDDPIIVRCALPSGARAASTMGAAQILTKPVFRDDLDEALSRLDRTPRRVLVVANDPDLMRLFRRLLRQRPSIEQCYESFTLAEASEMVTTLRPDLVVLDLNVADSERDESIMILSCRARAVGAALLVVSDQAHDYLSMALPGHISLYKPGGLGLDEILRVVANALSVLRLRTGSAAPIARVPMHQATIVELPA